MRAFDRRLVFRGNVTKTGIFSYEILAAESGGVSEPGTFYVSGIKIYLARLDSSNAALPAMPGQTVEINGSDYQISTYSASTTNIFGRRETNPVVIVELDNPLTPASTLAITLESVTFERDRVVWGERRESTPGDDIAIEHESQRWNYIDTIYRVRALGDVKYNVGATFIDEDGEQRTIRGIRKVGRAFYEIFTRLSE